jgi:HPt (histidine-containing phosphotransfer) domain-containing protein
LVVGSQGARHALPDDVARSLREAFAAECDARLPHLRAGGDLGEVLHDAHALASSAWVVGEREISILARAVEEELEAGAAPTDLPALVVALEGYAP